MEYIIKNPELIWFFLRRVRHLLQYRIHAYAKYYALDQKSLKNFKTISNFIKIYVITVGL
jgi:hypothetical protein